MPGRLLNFGKPHSSSPPDELSSCSQDALSSAKPKLTTEKARGGSPPKLGAMDHLKRSGFPGLPGKHGGPGDKKTTDKKTSEKKATASPKILPAKPKNNLEMIIESPPCMFQLSPTNSSGALLSGRLQVHVIDPELQLVKLDMQLLASISTRKPVQKDCPDCQTKVTELKQWEFLKDTKRLERGNHDFPFSHLLPGHLPTTTHGRIATLEYVLLATGTTARGEKLTLRRQLPVTRALKPANDKVSLRIFPPTNLTAQVTLNPVVFPMGEFDVTMLISGVLHKNKDGSTNRWRLRKMNWRIHEEERMVSPACARHAEKIGGVGKGVLHEETRTVGQRELQEGWKADWNEGNIYMQVPARPNPTQSPLCDVDSPTGLSVKHQLVIELVVAEEFVHPRKSGTQASPTGAARVLRMQFPLYVTQRAGLGISWDEEQPPMYEDVPASPPSYPVRSDVLDYTGPPLDDPPPFGLDAVANTPVAESSTESAADISRWEGGWDDGVDETARPQAESSTATRRGITVDDLNLLADDERPVTPEEEEEVDTVVVVS